MTKAVTIQIDRADLTTLRDLNYCMCFAKKVSNDFNVVWQSYDNYLMTNTFSWVTRYQLFVTDSSAAGVRVIARTNLVDVGLGQMLTFSAEGELVGPAVTDGDPEGITLTNNDGSIYPGLNSLAIGLDGQQHTTPIYVTRDLIGKGTNTLYPTEIVRVWFAQNTVTGMIIGNAPSNFVDIDMTETDTAAYLYKGQAWTPVT
jgi:hypothetical protein